MVFPQKVNWDILYQSADKMASIFLGLLQNKWTIWTVWTEWTISGPPTEVLTKLELGVFATLRGAGNPPEADKRQGKLGRKVTPQ